MKGIILMLRLWSLREWQINMNNINKNKAFTLVETLVAIAVLMIAIAGPLTVSSQAYTAALDAKNQAIATFLAQATIEYINYTKNNDWIIGSWPPSIMYSCTSGSPCNEESAVFNGNSIGDVMDFPEPFVLSYYFSQDPGGVVPSQIIVRAEVSWNTGSLSNSVSIEQVLTNHDR